jgi:hypothetical protein
MLLALELNFIHNFSPLSLDVCNDSVVLHRSGRHIRTLDSRGIRAAENVFSLGGKGYYTPRDALGDRAVELPIIVYCDMTMSSFVSQIVPQFYSILPNKQPRSGNRLSKYNRLFEFSNV